MSTTEFNSYNLRPELLQALEQRNFSNPTPVQEKVLELDDLDKDMVVQARTGSGKTLAFVLPLLNEMEAKMDRGASEPQVIILSPTRELAMQIAREAEWFGKHLDIDVTLLVGGMDMEHQIRKLRKGTSIVVGTPGRTLDHVRRRTLRTKEIHTVVLDEGDNMLDMGFRDELESILGALEEGRRTWLFSATMPHEVASLCKRYLGDPRWLTLDHDDDQHADITHRAYLVPGRNRLEGLVNILLWEHPERSLIFCHTRSDTVEVTEKLQEEGFLASALHGDMSQRERNLVMNTFRSGRIPTLVATNVAARGLDVEGVTHVIQLGLPDNLETFIHRSGRTGRAGKEGSNLLLLSPQESGRFKGMLRHSPVQVEWLKVPDVKEISVSQRELQEEKLLSSNKEIDENIQDWAISLLTKTDTTELVSRLLDKLVTDLPTGYSLGDKLQSELDRRSLRSRRDDRGQARGRYSRGERSRGDHMRGGSRRPSIKLCKGRKDSEWNVGRILGVLCSALDVDRTQIGNIRMRDTHTEVELGPNAMESLKQGGNSRLTRRGLLGDSVETSPSPRRSSQRTRRSR